MIASQQTLIRWNAAEMRDFTALTGRTEKSRKALSELVIVPEKAFKEFIRDFSANCPRSNNRMADAKGFQKTLLVSPLQGGPSRSIRLRAFNTVIFEEHFQ